MNIPLDEVIFFDCITTHPTTGAATDADSTPTFAVYEEATDTDIGVGGNLTKRASLTGNYRGTFTLSAANGFEVGKWYSIIGSATVNAIAGKGVLKNFRVVAAEATAGTTDVNLGTIKTQAVTCAAPVTVSPFVGSTGAAVNGTNANTLSSHDPGATLGTSTLTQTQVSGGAYALTSSSFAFNAAMDFTTAQKAATLARVALVDVTTTNSDMRGTNSALLASSYTAPDNTGIGVAASAAAAAATSGANIQTRIPAALSGGNMKADVLAIDGSTAAATAQKKAALTVITGTVGAGATTTEIPIKTLNMSIADIDQLLGLIIGFPVAAGTGRAGQKSDITGASPIGPVISVTALTRAPSEDDEFVIL